MIAIRTHTNTCIFLPQYIHPDEKVLGFFTVGIAYEYLYAVAAGT